MKLSSWQSVSCKTAEFLYSDFSRFSPYNLKRIVSHKFLIYLSWDKDDDFRYFFLFCVSSFDHIACRTEVIFVFEASGGKREGEHGARVKRDGRGAPLF